MHHFLCAQHAKAEESTWPIMRTQFADDLPSRRWLRFCQARNVINPVSLSKNNPGVLRVEYSGVCNMKQPSVVLSVAAVRVWWEVRKLWGACFFLDQRAN